MIAGYTAALCAPGFLYFEEEPGPLSGPALAERLSYFLWNGPPDEQLRFRAGELMDRDVLSAQTNRMLDDPRSQQFVNAFLDYWLELRRIRQSSPDLELYPDDQLDDHLLESMIGEPRRFFSELIRNDLDVGHLVDCDFTMLNESLARHYGIPNVSGIALRKVMLPKDSFRGGLMTQAGILKVTSNGTTTSPVLRGAWINKRILGKPTPPPPPTVPAIEPDIRGAVTIRQQLAQHSADESCQVCHREIDPPGFALESFDVMGKFRSHYRTVGAGKSVKGIGHNGLTYAFRLGQPVDSTGQTTDGHAFDDIREFKQHLLKDRKQLARNLLRQLTVFATGAPIGFADRATIEKILDRCGPKPGVRTIILELIQSELFRHK